MLKTNWSHVVAQNPPPTWPVIPRDFTIPSAVENSTKQTPWSEKAFAVNLTFILGEGRWPESQSNSNGWQWMDDSCPFVMICFIQIDWMMENSWIFARVPMFTDGHLFEILVSWNHLAVRWGTDPTALPSIHSPIFLPKLFGKILEIQTSISVGYGLWQLKHGVN